MTAIWSHIKELFGFTDLPYESYHKPKQKPIPKAAPQIKLKVADSDSPKLVHWWDYPVQKSEETVFEAIENTVLYDELKTILKESRLEVIELPETISAIMKKVHLKHFWYHEIVELIEKSPVLAGDFLSIVNSAAFSRGMFIHDLNLALPRLGRKKIQSILFLNASKMSLPETPLSRKVSEEIICQSQVVAKICRILSHHFGVDHNEAFLAGLLHNIGRIGLLKQISNHYNLPDDLDMEYHQSIFNNIIPHFEQKAAQKIAEYWKLEDRVIRAIICHRNLERMDRSLIHSDVIILIALVNLSVYISRILGFGDSLEEADLFGQTSAKILGFFKTEKNMKLLYMIKDSFNEPETQSEESVA